MPRHLRRTIALLGIMAVVGCGRENVPPTANLPKPAASTTAEVAAAPAEPEMKTADASDATSPPPVDQPDPKPAAAPTADEATKADKAPPTERIAILTPGGPLLVDVRLTIASRPHTEVFEALVKQVLDAGDTDHDGRPTWKEFADNRTYLKEQMPNAPAAGSRQMKALIERYDENRDGRIQHGEAASWLGRDAGMSASAFALRSTRSFVPIPRATSQVWHLLDSDNNGRLSNDEIQGAPEKLLSLDADDDRIITPPEMASLREQLEAASPQRVSLGRPASHYAAIHLEPTVEIDRLHYLLSDLYAPRQDLGPTSFSDLPGLFDKLDANGDHWLDLDELASILSIDPHVRLSVAFDQPTTSESARATVQVDGHSPEIEIAAQPAADRVVLLLGNTRLIVSAHNLSPQPNAAQNAGQAATQSQVRLMVHDQCDALFEELDTNADGRLGEREIAFCAERFSERDADRDGKLANDELPYSMIVAFLLAEPPAEQSYYVPTSSAAMAKSDIRPPPWFSRADLNGDGDVSRREFVGSNEQFLKLDTDHDNYISGAEAAALQPN